MRAGQGQTLMDVAVTECGAAELAWEIAVRSGFCIADAVGGEELTIPAGGGDPDTAAAMAASGARPATDGSAAPINSRSIGTAMIGTDRIN